MRTHRSRTARAVVITGLTAGLALSGCARAGETTTEASDGAPTEILMWTHSAGNDGELTVYDQIIEDFNASQDQYTVVTEAFPQSSYNDSIVAAAASGDLPCLISMDGPIMPNWAWAGYIQPLDLPTSLTDSLLPTAVGTYQDEIYSVGYWDAAIAIFARQSVLDANGIRIPTVDQPWTKDEFDAALTTLKQAGYETPLDIGAEDTGEWWSYAYLPFLASFGGDEINRETYLSADGYLNGPDAVAAFTWFQDVFKNGWSSAGGTIGNQEFIDGDAALAYTGVWNAKAALEAVGDDLLILPPPDFGHGAKTGGGSWTFGITSQCQAADGAREYLEFSFQDEYIAAFSDNQVVIPATDGAAAMSEYFGADGSLEAFVEISKAFAMMRPETPAYPVISSQFEKAAKEIMNGADVQSTLNVATQEIDTNIESNDGYGF
ncbi:MAG: extracellular solute-binding protein [Propionibacteriaceae bacterium]|jgi:multiple sugar transport system substrate-binding protein|nr:extracellular solute-binding protein [Propionibacteriaceae bacterium]